MESNKQILYIEDEEINKFLFKNYFKNKYEVFIANLGQEGLDILDQQPDISLVISDFKMPLMDGVDFIKKATEKHPDKSYFILSGYEMTDKIFDALESGLIVKKFTKPIRYEVLEKELKEEFWKKQASKI